MSFSTNVPQPSFTPVGFVSPDPDVVLAGVQADFTAAFGANLNPALNTPQGQLETSLTAVIVDKDDDFVLVTNQVDPAFATGRFQDAIARIYFLTRDPAEPTVLQIICTGFPGVPIPVGALIADASGNIYSCTNAGTISGAGTVTLPFANQVPGPIAVPNTNDVQIYQTIPQWDTVSVASGVLGRDTESRAEFEARREATVAANGQGFLDSIVGAVLQNVPGVLDALARENPTGSPVVVQGVTLAPHSLYVAVVGGAAADIAQQIWNKKDPGCNYNGNTTIDIEDTNPAYSPPYPTYPVTFEIPTGIATCFNVSIVNSPQVPSNAGTLVQQAVLAGFNGQDGGSRAGIGATIFASRYVCDIAALGTWAQIVSLEVGTDAAPDAHFTASIATGGTLTVTAVATGTLAPGQFVFGGGVAAGSVIVAQLTGSAGSTGTYSLEVVQTVTSEAMTSVAAVHNTATLDLDQVPTLAAGNVNMTLV